MKKLNGWYRIGVVLSVLWLLVANIGGFVILRSLIARDLLARHSQCMDNAYQLPEVRWDAALEKCDIARAELSNTLWSGFWWQIPITSLVILALGWALVVVSVNTFRWIRAGFTQP
jgi:hypothetical protein